MSEIAQATPRGLREAGLLLVGLAAAAVLAYSTWTLELVLIVPPAIAALTAGAGVVGAIGSRLESRTARAVAALAVPVAFAGLAFVMITVSMRLMYHTAAQVSIMGFDSHAVWTHAYSGPFWLASAVTAVTYAANPSVGSRKLATSAFSVAVISTAALMAALALRG